MKDNLYGYAGKQLRILLSEKTVKEEDLDEGILRQYLGGAGYAARLLYDELVAGVDPLGPDNKLIFATSPLTRRRVPGGGSLEVCFKSPLTGLWGEARSGGEFGFALRNSGYDFLIVEGKAEKPVYLVIDDGKIDIREANAIRGKQVSEKISYIKQELSDEDYSLLTIGPAGENQVLYSTIMVDERAAGRVGGGAVMGSKNLLAVAVRGTKEVKIAEKEKYMQEIKKAHKIVSEHPDTPEFKKHGTTGDLGGCDAAGDFPTKNWQSNSWGKGEELYEHFYENNLITNSPCYKGCPVGCGRKARVNDGEYKTPAHEGNEYESMAAFTAFILNENVDAAVHSDYLCNEYGLDTISTGAVIAFSIECSENNIIKESEIDGVELTWGNPRVLPVLINKIVNREGIGDLLAIGVKKAAEELGHGAMEFAVQVKGLEAPAHDPRSGKALAVSYGTGNRGSCHIHPVEAMCYDSGKMDFKLSQYGLKDPEEVDRWDEKGKGKAVKLLQDGLTLPDIMVTCKFLMYVGLGIEDYSRILAAVTGWDIDDNELLKIGERAINLQRLFNIREGLKREDDMIHERMGKLPAFGNYSKKEDCVIKDFSAMLDEYYQARGWNIETGKPRKEKLEELGL